MDYDSLFRIVIVGDSGVGKSNLLLRYTDNYFSENFISTIGVDFKIQTIQLAGKYIKLQFWDTAGQERFEAITRNYYRGCDAIVVVYDITNQDSFNHISKWMKKIDQLANPTVIRFLVGNKSDLNEKRQVSKGEGQDLADSYGVRFMEASAKTKENVNELFVELAQILIKHADFAKRAKEDNIKKLPPSATVVVPGQLCSC